ncbi:hypothetical protein WME91_09205 [Sorangium sp. So ce269]
MFVTKTPVFGAPKDELMSTSFVERFNLTTRHTVGRTRRLCLAFSKTIRGHRAAIGLGIASYNWVRAHGTLGTTPAVAAGLAERPWTLAELVTAALAEEETAPPVPQPLKLEPRPGETPAAARELPGGRGWLRLVSGGSGPPGPVAPQPLPVAPTAAPSEPEPPPSEPPPAPGPRPGRMVQLNLFDEPA